MIETDSGSQERGNSLSDNRSYVTPSDRQSGHNVLFVRFVVTVILMLTGWRMAWFSAWDGDPLFWADAGRLAVAVGVGSAMLGHVLHAVTALLSALIARAILGPGFAPLSALVYATAPFATFPIAETYRANFALPLFALGIFAFVRLVEDKTKAWAIVLGAVFGIGIWLTPFFSALAVSAGFAVLLIRRVRMGLQNTVIAFLVAVLVCVIAVVGSGGYRAPDIRPDFIGAAIAVLLQIAIYGPVALALWLWAVVRAFRVRKERFIVVLSSSTMLMAILYMLTIAPNPFAAVPAYICGSALVAARLADRPRLARLAIGINLAMSILLPPSMVLL